MELDDLKHTWEEMGERVNKNQNLDPKLFDKMNKQKIYSNLYKIILPEMLGSIVCVASAIYIAVNFYRLDTAVFKLTGVLTTLLLLILPVLSVISIQKLYKTGDPDKTYAETLKEFSVQKIQFCKLQKWNMTLSYLLLVTTIILSARLFGRNDITNSAGFWIFSISFGYIFLLFFSRWVGKRYNKTIRKTEDLLKDLSN